MFSRILVPYDRSEMAEMAFPVAASLAQASSGLVLVLEVLNAPPMIGTGNYDDLMRSYSDEATSKLLERIDQVPSLKGVRTETQIRFGAPAQGILDAVTSQAVDLIVMCSHGRTGIRRWALGSVAWKIARQSPVPVLILRNNNGHVPEPRVLVPLDGSLLAEEALESALSLVESLTSHGSPGALHLVRVIEDKDDEQEVEAYLSDQRRRLQQWASNLSARITITSSALQEQPGEGIASTIHHVAEQGGWKVIAISTHGRSGLRHLTLGSVMESLLELAALPLMIVRPPMESVGSVETWIGKREVNVYEPGIVEGYKAGIKEAQSPMKTFLTDNEFTGFIDRLVPHKLNQRARYLWRAYFIVGWIYSQQQAIEAGYNAGAEAFKMISGLEVVEDWAPSGLIPRHEKMLTDEEFKVLIDARMPRNLSGRDRKLWRSHFIAGWLFSQPEVVVEGYNAGVRAFEELSPFLADEKKYEPMLEPMLTDRDFTTLFTVLVEGKELESISSYETFRPIVEGYVDLIEDLRIRENLQAEQELWRAYFIVGWAFCCLGLIDVYSFNPSVE